MRHKPADVGCHMPLVRGFLSQGSPSTSQLPSTHALVSAEPGPCIAVQRPFAYRPGVLHRLTNFTVTFAPHSSGFLTHDSISSARPDRLVEAVGSWAHLQNLAKSALSTTASSRSAQSIARGPWSLVHNRRSGRLAAPRGYSLKIVSMARPWPSTNRCLFASHPGSPPCPGRRFAAPA